MSRHNVLKAPVSRVFDRQSVPSHQEILKNIPLPSQTGYWYIRGSSFAQCLTAVHKYKTSDKPQYAQAKYLFGLKSTDAGLMWENINPSGAQCALAITPDNAAQAKKALQNLIERLIQQWPSHCYYSPTLASQADYYYDLQTELNNVTTNSPYQTCWLLRESRANPYHIVLESATRVKDGYQKSSITYGLYCNSAQLEYAWRPLELSNASDTQWTLVDTDTSQVENPEEVFGTEDDARFALETLVTSLRQKLGDFQMIASDKTTSIHSWYRPLQQQERVSMAFFTPTDLGLTPTTTGNGEQKTDSTTRSNANGTELASNELQPLQISMKP